MPKQVPPLALDVGKSCFHPARGRQLVSSNLLDAPDQSQGEVGRLLVKGPEPIEHFPQTLIVRGWVIFELGPDASPGQPQDLRETRYFLNKISEIPVEIAAKGVDHGLDLPRLPIQQVLLLNPGDDVGKVTAEVFQDVGCT